MNDIIADLKVDEGFESRPYKCTAGANTIGYGRNLDALGISEEEAEHMLRNDVARVEHELDKAYPWWVKCPGSVRRAMTNMVFNLGINRFSTFKRMIGCLQAGDYKGASLNALDSKWADQVGDRAIRIAAQIAEAKGD